MKSLATLVRLSVPTRPNCASVLLLSPPRTLTKDLRAACVSSAAQGVENMEDNAPHSLSTHPPTRERERNVICSNTSGKAKLICSETQLDLHLAPT